MSIMLKITVIVAIVYLFIRYVVLETWINGLSKVDKLRWTVGSYTRVEQFFLLVNGILRLATYICGGITIIVIVFHYL